MGALRLLLISIALCATLTATGVIGSEGEQTFTSREQVESEIRRTEEELQRIRDDLAEKRKMAEDLAGEEMDLQAEIDRINEEIRLNRSLLDKLAEQKIVLIEDLKYSQHDLELAELALDESRKLLNHRLRSIYKFGRGQAMEVILTSKTFADLAKRIYYLTMIADHDREIIEDYAGQVESKRVLVKYIEGKKSKIEEVEAEARIEADNLRLRKEERDGLVRKLKEKRYYYENLARDLEEASRNLETVIGDLESRAEAFAQADTTFEGRMGTLMWPCDGEVVSEFGMETHPRFGTIIKNNGIDIRTEPGTKVRAVAPGQVSFAGPLSGFGNCIIVSHGDGFYTLYGHLESLLVAKGYKVGEGEAIGYIGETSTPEGAILHFEIRKGKAPLDPDKWFLK
jgi:septal ring factor EnvC (AmiA/AmiB activator)